jgi:sec-independent protein translocase protein TatC
MASVMEELGYITEGLKKKLIPIFAVVVAGFMVTYFFLDPVLEKMKADLLPEGATLIYISPVEVIMLKLKIAVTVGILLAVPLVWHYVYKTLKVRFGLRNPIKSSRLIIYLSSAVLLFVAGVCYSYFIMLPLLLGYLYFISASAGVLATYSIYEFVSFVILMTLLLGITFEVPILIIFLVQAGLVQIKTLKENRRYVIVAMFVIGAITTPPDVLSQLVVAFPLVIFYEVGIQVSSLLMRRRAKALPAA